MWPLNLIKRRRIRKESEFVSEIKKYARSDYCLLCGQKMTSPCNSHVVPQFILKVISEEGKVAYGHYLNLIEVGGFNKITGLNNAYTFKLICKKCDNKHFSHYENPENLINFSSLSDSEKKIILCEMAIKTHLSHIQTKYQRLILMDKSTLGGVVGALEDNVPIPQQLDMVEHRSYIKKLKKMKMNNKNPFYILFDKELEYQTKIATQTIINYNFDLKGNRIFNPYLFTCVNHCRYFYLMILPFNGKTRILFYIENSNLNNVKPIVDDFNNLNDAEKLHFIFVSLIIHDQEFYMSPSFANNIFKKDKKLVKLYTLTENIEEQYRIRDFRYYSNYLKKEYNE